MVPRRQATYHPGGTMLRRLRIENLVLIHEADLVLAPGLNAITGETGAGKTILAQAIGLLLGAKEIRPTSGRTGPRRTSRPSSIFRPACSTRKSSPRSPIFGLRTRRG